ncbi:hypothetical protein NG99_12755, partial [Erwinia typographi]
RIVYRVFHGYYRNSEVRALARTLFKSISGYAQEAVSPPFSPYPVRLHQQSAGAGEQQKVIHITGIKHLIRVKRAVVTLNMA